jgi:hypothetical protein
MKRNEAYKTCSTARSPVRRRILQERRKTKWTSSRCSITTPALSCGRTRSYARVECVSSPTTDRLLFVLVILAHERRRVVHVVVTDHPIAT